MAVEETGYGNVADKILKNKFGSEFVHEAIKDLRTVGIVKEDKDKGVLEIASPVGGHCRHNSLHQPDFHHHKQGPDCVKGP